ncbi:MAG: hypothetical protein IKE31_07485 [Eubacterium sp.]|nr:hypothetical protein [Eubacterium sp.]
MKKKWTAVCLAAAMALMTAACGTGTSPEKEAASGASAPAEETASETKEAAEETVSEEASPAEETASEAEEAVSEAASVTEETVSGSEEDSSETASEAEEAPGEAESEEAAGEEADAVSEEAPEAIDLTGLYRLVEMDKEGEITGKEEIETREGLGLIVYADLKEDGTAVIDLYGETLTGTWAADGSRLEDEPVIWTPEGDLLRLVQGNTSMTFEKTTRDYIDSVLGEETEGEDASSDNNEASGIVSIEDGIVIDTEDCRMEITGYEPYGEYGYTIYTVCENKTADKNMRFTITESAVNRYMIDPLWSAEVAPGSVSYENIVYSSIDLEEVGASEPQEFLWGMWVYNSDDYGANPYFDKTVAVYPNGKPEEPVAPAARRTTDTEMVLVANDDLTVVILEQNFDETTHGFTAFIENKKDYPIMVSWDNVTVNGTPVDPFWAVQLLPHTRAYSDIEFANTDLEYNHITEIKEITCTMTAYNAEDWMAEHLLDDTYTFAP